MDYRADERDLQVLMADRYTFSVLGRILRKDCDLVLTDHERMILCHSAAAYPVWLWTKDGMTEEEKRRVWDIAMGVRDFKGGYRYNLKYELAEYFIDRAQKDGVNVKIKVNMFAYDCPEAIAPVHCADGGLCYALENEIDEAAELMGFFYVDIGEKAPDIEIRRQKAKEHIENRRFFVWKDAEGRTVACCYYHRQDETVASISGVYTVPEFRRRHYAQNMVYEVSRIIAAKNLTPMLYTDADYAASNACYEKVGYVLRGKLCTIGT